jgi:hypothetical protein
MLTPAEAHELSGKLECIDHERGDHIHVSDENFEVEVTVSVYAPENLHWFSPRVIEHLRK